MEGVVLIGGGSLMLSNYFSYDNLILLNEMTMYMNHDDVYFNIFGAVLTLIQYMRYKYTMEWID